ncbi:MAG TPA: IS30 family transposase [Gemmatimonadales bacterium]|nr:IS30 family transposase [Gemmatimonadales bacterium]
MKYRQLASEERYLISAFRIEGFNQAQIATRLGRAPSTVCRELARNHCPADGRYRPSKAHDRARWRRSRARRNQRFGAPDLALVERWLREDWSPEQVAGRLGEDGVLSISHETIYRHVWADKRRGGDLFRHLRGAQKQRRKRYGAYDSRGRLAGKRSLAERPACVETRQQLGHWEIDTVMGAGAQDCIVTAVERKTGYAVIGKLPERTTDALNRRTIQLIRRHEDCFHTITADNGTEFHAYARIEAATGARFYFAAPYHSWERGSNENLNGLVRQYLPKRVSMAGLTQQHCNAIAHKLNRRPRKRLGYKTPEECFYG